jgi:hypothetical protein
MSITSKISSVWKSLNKKIKELTTSQSNKKVKDLIKEKKKLKKRDLRPGNLIFTTYDAKDKEQTYDKTPLVLILRRNGTHTLGLNFHWIPLSMRINLIKIIIQMNVQNIQRGRPLQFTYENLRPLLKQFGYAPVIRLYINNRLGGVGVVIPPERLIEVARLKTESFTNGRYSAGQLYQMARKRGKKKSKK